MCKILIMTGIKDGYKAFEFMRAMAVPMSQMNRDGIGYTAINPDGSMFAERWHNNFQFLNREDIMIPEVAKKLKKFKNRLPLDCLETNYSLHGEGDLTKATTITMHTRYATTGTEFANTHPFIYEDISLIHNGMIGNWKELNVNKISTCDSEAALQTYISNGVNLDIEKTQPWANSLEGGYAFGVLAKDADGNRILDVVKGSSSLYKIEIEGLGLIFTTDDRDAVASCKKLGLNILSSESLLYGTLLRYNALSGEQIGTFDIKAKPIAPRESYWGGSYSHGRSSWRPSTSTTTEVKTLPITDETLIPFVENYPDLFRPNGKWNYSALNTFFNDSMEPIIERFEVFDKVFGRNYVTQYEALCEEDKMFLNNYDLTYDFRATRAALLDLAIAV